MSMYKNWYRVCISTGTEYAYKYWYRVKVGNETRVSMSSDNEYV